MGSHYNDGQEQQWHEGHREKSVSSRRSSGGDSSYEISQIEGKVYKSSKASSISRKSPYEQMKSIQHNRRVSVGENFNSE